MGRVVSWQFNPDDYNENSFSPIPEGEYRVRIQAVEETTSSKGNRMLKITLAVSGYRTKLWKYIVLDNSSAEAAKRTNQRLGELFNSFNITKGNMEIDSWINHVGGVKVRHVKGDDGQTRAEVHYFLKRFVVDRLPAWRTNDNSSDGMNTSAPVEDTDFYPEETAFMAPPQPDIPNPMEDIIPF